MKALIAYASMTGNTEEACDAMAEALEDLGVEVDMDSSLNLFGEDFLDVDICVVGTYTYGSELPDDVVDLYEDLEDLDLTGKVFISLGSGDHDYPDYCQSVDDFYDQFLQTGAQAACPAIKIEIDCNAEDIETIEAGAQAAVNLAKQKPH